MANRRNKNDDDFVEDIMPVEDRRIVLHSLQGQPSISAEDAKLLVGDLVGNNARKQVPFILALAQLGNRARAMQSVNVSRVTVWQWLQDPTFKIAFDRAMELGSDMMEDELMRRACEGVMKPVFQGGHLVGSVREYSDTLLIFGLKGAKPDKYADRQKVEVTDTVTRLRAARERALGRKTK